MKNAQPLALGSRVTSHGGPPAFVDDFSIMSLNLTDAAGVAAPPDGVVRISMFSIGDCGGVGAPEPGAVMVARVVLTRDKARQLADVLNQHLGRGGDAGAEAQAESRFH